MKKIGLGIAIILFCIFMEMAYSGFTNFMWFVAVVGLVFAIVGFVEMNDKS